MKRFNAPVSGGGVGEGEGGGAGEGAAFEDLIEHFLLGSDEACLMAAPNGMVKVLGDAEKRKHEHINSDSRESITFLRTASTGGATGPTQFLIKGTKVKAGYTKAWLTRHGAPPGSSIVPTPTAFMTEAAWLEMAEDRAKGIRAMPVIKDHPLWWVAEILDGFGAHFMNPQALAIYWRYRIMQIKEEGDTSQVNQLYDRDPAKKDKVVLRDGNAMLREAASVTRGVVDQWGLVAVGLMAVREGVKKPEMWVEAAQKVNLHPPTRRPFSVWLSEISHFLQGGKSFKMEAYSSDIYPLLPDLWHAMDPTEKRTVMAIVERNEGKYTPKCLHELYFEAHVLYTDMQKLRLCVSAAKDNPDHLNRGMPAEDPGGNVAPEVAAALAAQLPVTHGLATFELKPPGLTGEALFEHMVAFRARHGGDKRPPPSLAVEMTDEQVEILAPTMQDLSVQAILKDAGGSGATKKLAKRKLNNTGAITNHCGLQNHPERVKRLLSALELTASLAEISALAKSNKHDEKCIADTELMDMAPAALLKLNSEKVNGDMSKLTKKQICAISFRYFGSLVKEANPKPVLLAGLEGLVSARPTVLLEAAAAAPPLAAPAPAPAALALAAPAAVATTAV